MSTGSLLPAAGPGRQSRRTRWMVGLVVFALIGSLLLTVLPSRADLGLPGDPASGAPTQASLSHPADLTTPGWTTFHGSEDRSGFTLASGPTTPRIFWERAVGKYPIRNGAVVSGSSVFAADTLGEVTRLNGTVNGSKVWNTTVGLSPTTPDITATDLFIGDARGNVTDLLRANGGVRWSVGLGGGAIVQGIVVENRTVVAGTSTGSVVALDESTGARRWATTLPGPVAGALAFGSGTFYAVTTAGQVVQILANGTLGWTAAVGKAVDSGVALGGRSVFVADELGNVTALWASNGSREWRFHDSIAGDKFESTPGVGPGLIAVASDSGGIFGVDPANGRLLWFEPPQVVGLTGYADISSPVVTSQAVYLVDANGELDDLNVSSGAFVWRAFVGSQAVYSSPALGAGHLILGNEVGFVIDYASAASTARHPVTGTVTNRTGQPLSGALIDAGIASATAHPNGSFSLSLTNGSYVLNVTAPGYLPTLISLNVTGPAGPFVIVLRALPVFPITGFVRDARTDRPLGNANVTLFGEFGYITHARSAADGSFTLRAPNGTNYVTVDPVPGFLGLQTHLTVSGGLAAPFYLGLRPVGVSVNENDPYRFVVVLGLAAAAAGALAAGLGWRTRRQAEGKLTSSVLTPFERFVAMRLLLIPGQIVAVLTLLYVFGTFLPAAALQIDPCSIAVGTCSGASWSNPGSIVTIFFGGYGTFLWNLFSGQWGYAAYGGFHAPAANFLTWWGPYSLELAVVALILAVAIAYPLGLVAGWRPERPVDVGTRVGSITALLVPTFLVVLLLLSVIYLPFVRYIGDIPYGILPTGTWFGYHGGPPTWIAITGNTGPTGFPLVDGALHADWQFVAVVASKTLLQATIIAIVYVAIFLRFARHAVAEAAAEPHVTAARSRGVPEPRLLWGHTGRRVLPIFVLVFGLTIPIFIGTLVLVEAMFSDPGLGTLLLVEMTNVTVAKFGFAGLAASHPGNMYQVLIFLTLLIVLFASLAADILARLLDPRLAAGERV